ncbi:MAG: hypothetical protein H6811_00455 [Phycisphaeraceae bacterium]|nr:hypothetical protein [Phycisphaeraceae bacterium]
MNRSTEPSRAGSGLGSAWRAQPVLTFALALGLTLGLPAFESPPDRFDQRVDERHWVEGLERAVRRLATMGAAPASGLAMQAASPPRRAAEPRSDAPVLVLFARTELTDLPPPASEAARV